MCVCVCVLCVYVYQCVCVCVCVCVHSAAHKAVHLFEFFRNKKRNI